MVEAALKITYLFGCRKCDLSLPETVSYILIGPIGLHVFTGIFFANYMTPAWALISMINSHGSTFAVHNITFDVSRDLSTL